MPDPSRRPPPQTTGQPPRQGALVVLLSAMLMVNLTVVIVVLAGDWFEKRGPVDGQRVAQAEAEPAADQYVPTHPGADSLRTPPVRVDADREGPATPAPPLADSEDRSTPDARLPRSSPADEPDTEPVTATPPSVEFFGLPLFD